MVTCSLYTPPHYSPTLHSPRPTPHSRHTAAHHHTPLRTAALHTTTYRYIVSSLRIAQTRSLTTRFSRHSPHTAPHAAGSFLETHRHDDGRRAHVTHEGVKQRPRGHRTGFDRGRPFAEAHPDEGTWWYYAYGVHVVDGLGACVCEGLWKGVHAPGVIATTLSAISLYLTHPCTISLCVGNVGTIDDSRVVCLLTPHSPSFAPRDLFCLPHLPPLVIAEQEGEKEGRDGSIDGQERRDQSTAQSGGISVESSGGGRRRTVTLLGSLLGICRLTTCTSQ